MTAKKIPMAIDDPALMSGYMKFADEMVSRIEAAMGFWVNLPQAAKWLSQWLAMKKSMEEAATAGGDRIYRSVVARLNLPVTADALKSWADICTNTWVSLNQNYSNSTRIYLNDLAECMGGMGRSNSVIDLIPVYVSLMNGVKDHVQASAADLFGALNAFHSAVEIWMKKSLSAYEACGHVSPNQEA